MKIGDKEEDVNCLGNCVLVLPPQSSYDLHVVTSNETIGTRHIKAVEVIEPKVEVFDFEKFSVVIKPNTDFKEIEFTNKDSDKSAVLLNSISPGVVAQAMEGTSLIGNQISLDVQDFLTEKSKFKLTLNVSDKTKETIFDFKQWLVTRNCSGTILLIDKVELKTVNKSSVLSRSTHTCVYQVSVAEGNLELESLVLKTDNDYDTIVVKDGFRLTSKTLISSISKQAVLTDLDSRLSSGNRMMVILTSNFAAGRYEQGSVTIKKSDYNVIDKLKNLSIITSGTYIFRFDKGYPYLTFDKKFKLSKQNLSVQDRVYGEPVLEYQSDEWIFNELWSGAKALVLNFTSAADAKPQTLNVKLIAKDVSCSKLVTQPSSILLNGTAELNSQTCHFYFRPNPAVYSIGLQLQNVRLGKGACLKLSALNAESAKFSICAKDGDIKSENVPDFILRSNDSYILSYENQETYSKDRIILQASFLYHAVPTVRSYNLTKAEPSITINSFDYPDNYPYYLDNTEIDQVTSDTHYLAVSFAKHGLRTGDALSFIGKTLNYTHNYPDDFLHVAEKSENQSSLITSFITKFDQEKKLQNLEHGEGYKLVFERFACVLKYEKNILTTPGYPNKFVGASR